MQRPCADCSMGRQARVNPHPRVWRGRSSLFLGQESSPGEEGEAARGGGVAVMTPAGATVEVTVPAGSGGGRKLRLKGRGIPSSTTPGDLYLELEIAVPGAVTPEQKSAWEALKQTYPGFDPRIK